MARDWIFEMKTFTSGRSWNHVSIMFLYHKRDYIFSSKLLDTDDSQVSWEKNKKCITFFFLFLDLRLHLLKLLVDPKCRLISRAVGTRSIDSYFRNVRGGKPHLLVCLPRNECERQMYLGPSCRCARCREGRSSRHSCNPYAVERRIGVKLAMRMRNAMHRKHICKL